ncbi:sigma-70 family RNA polymerase sigma factor [Priestia sp. JNUCC 25]
MSMVAGVEVREEKTNLNDEEIVQAFQKGDEDVFNVLIKKYEYLVWSKVKRYFLLGGDREDLLQEARLGLYKAVRDFKTEGMSSFRGFADLCITRQLITAIKASARQKHSPLNNAISLNIPKNSKRWEDDLILMEMLPHPRAVSPNKLPWKKKIKEKGNRCYKKYCHLLKKMYSLYI